VKAITDEWKTILYTPADDSPSHVTYLNGNLYLCASYPIFSPDKDATPLYTLIISLDTEMLRDRLLSFNPYDSGCAVLYHSGQGFLLAKSISDALPLQIIGNQALLERLSGGESLTVEQNGEKFLVVGAFSDYMNMIFFSCVAQKDVFGGLWYYRSLFTIFFAVMLAVAVAFSAGSYYLIRRPMKRLVYSLKRVEKGDLTVRIQHSLNDEYAYLYDTFNNMANALQNLIDLNYKQTLLTQQAEMRQLQTQINPHFLYNSFFTLYRMAKDGDIDDVTEFLVYLSDYYRFITRDAHSEIPLRQEVSHAENYAHIQQIRFRRRLKVVLDELPEQVQGKRVPRLILQPVLENAFNYGFKDMVENGILHVGYRLEAGFLYIDVENNGTDVPEEMMESLRRQLAAADGLEEITGLINIHRRLKLKFGPESGLRIRHGADGGLLVTLVIPEV
jgi:two-component system, sensor histidine kinase YesM